MSLKIVLKHDFSEFKHDFSELKKENETLKRAATQLFKDSDRDGFTDEHDRCINEPETWNQIDDHDGCPEHELTDSYSGSQPARDSDDLCSDIKCYAHAILGRKHFLKVMRSPSQAKKGFITEEEIEKVRLKSLKLKKRFSSFEVCGLGLDTSKGFDDFSVPGYGGVISVSSETIKVKNKKLYKAIKFARDTCAEVYVKKQKT